MGRSDENARKGSDPEHSWTQDFKEHLKEFVEATPEQHVT